MPEQDWMTIVANKLESLDLSIVFCIIAMIFFMRYNRREGRNKANQFIGICLGSGFLILITLRILTSFKFFTGIL